jgi:hypothetical protein
MRTFLAAALLLATPAVAQEAGQCADGRLAMKELREDGYFPASTGLIDHQSLFSVYATKGGDNWIAVQMRADGKICVITKGTDISRLIIEPRGEKV